jgi:hypothetical protein
VVDLPPDTGPLVWSLSAERASHMSAGQVPSLAVAAPGLPRVTFARFRQLRKGLCEPVPGELAAFQQWLDRII